MNNRIYGCQIYVQNLYYILIIYAYIIDLHVEWCGNMAKIYTFQSHVATSKFKLMFALFL